MALVKAHLTDVKIGGAVVVVQRFLNKADVAHIGSAIAINRDALLFTDGRRINLKVSPEMPSTPSIYLVKNKA